MIIITGQTATGKTDLAIKLAQKYNGELVNFDSRQIYKYLDIITGKDLREISNIKYQISNILNIGYYLINNENQIKIWLYDIVYPNEYFSSFEYVKIAEKVIDDIQKRGKTPILVGGTYFYLKHLLYGFDYQVPPDFKLREKLNQKSVSELQQIIKKLDPEIEQKMNQSDWLNLRRLIRRIEILKAKTKIPIFFTPWDVFHKSEKGTHLSKKKLISSFIGLKHKNKSNLYQAIKTRVEKRLKQGAVEEVEKILKMGYKKTDPGLQTIGYKQIIDYLEGKITKEKAIENWITAEIHYAKRQYTFMKKDKNIKWKNI
ncbi:MAG: tRNA (adenosine(37)-N6)-dimethylallyltransferase MiaA [Candidatus Microgenomates bacterium]